MLKSTSWDGKDRIGELCGILWIGGSIETGELSDSASDGTVTEEHGRDYSWDGSHESVFLAKWLHQCVAMALNNDSAPYGADGVLVLQAPQGTGKTFFCRTVAMQLDWFAEVVSIDLDNKDSIIQGTGVS